jgi:hypothetical protein
VRPVIWNRIIQFFEWLPLLVTPFVIYFLTDGFTRPLKLEIWLIIGIAVVVNAGWIAMQRYARTTASFLEKYPGFRMRKNG